MSILSGRLGLRLCFDKLGGRIIGHPVCQILLDFLEIEPNAIEVELSALPIRSCFVVLSYHLLCVGLMLVLGKILALASEELKSSEREDFSEEEEEVGCGHHSLFAGVLIYFLHLLAVPLKIQGNGLHQ